MSQSLQRVVLGAIKEQSISPELREVGKGGSFCVGDGGVPFELGVAEREKSEGCYLAGILGEEGVLSESVQKC
jgi:hypothetical protein